MLRIILICAAFIIVIFRDISIVGRRRVTVTSLPLQRPNKWYRSHSYRYRGIVTITKAQQKFYRHTVTVTEGAAFPGAAATGSADKGEAAATDTAATDTAATGGAATAAEAMCASAGASA
jgi:hypothetical protein